MKIETQIKWATASMFVSFVGFVALLGTSYLLANPTAMVLAIQFLTLMVLFAMYKQHLALAILIEQQNR